MKIIIADDEPLARQRLTRLLTDLSADYAPYAEAENGLDALTLCLQHKPDIILLDIRMPKMDGLQTAVEINKAALNTSIVFVTAYDEHAIAAFDNNAIDYLLKPIKRDRLLQALEKAQQYNVSTIPPSLNINEKLLVPRQHLCAHSHTGINIVKVADIICLKADHKYVSAFTATETILLDESLKTLEHEFPKQFTRIHRNALINLKAVKRVDKNATGQHYVTLEQLDEPVLVSRRHIPELRKLLQ